MARKSATKKEVPFQERLTKILEKEKAVYDKERIVRRFVITFPNRQKAPKLGRLAVWLLGLSRAQIQIQYDELR